MVDYLACGGDFGDHLLLHFQGCFWFGIKINPGLGSNVKSFDLDSLEIGAVSMNFFLGELLCFQTKRF